MPISRSAHYLDGRTATRHRVTLTITPTSLHIGMPDGSIKQWPYEQIRQTQGTYRGEPVRLEFGQEPAEAVVTGTTALLREIHKAAPAGAQHFHNPTSRNARVRWTVYAAEWSRVGEICRTAESARSKTSAKSTCRADGWVYRSHLSGARR